MREYHYINVLLFAAVLMPAVAVKFDWVTLHCIYAQRGGSCSSCGLTRAAEAAMNGNFAAMLTLLGGQLFFRPAVSLLLARTKKLALIRNTDITVNAGLLVVYLVA